MKYTIAQLAEIIDGDRGAYYPKQNEFQDEGYCLFLDAGNVTVNGFSFDNNQFISERKHNLLRKGVLEYGDIVYTTRGTIGNVAYYWDKIPYPHVRINSGMVILRTKQDVVNPLFLYHLLRHKNYRAYVTQYSTGSAQPQLPIKTLSIIKLDIPSLARQNKIASILSAYDVLIENNQKRIKLLEETTQQLYKEWFVRLRFPGYETTPIVDGVPKGWKYSALTDLLEIKYGKEHKGLNDGEIPVYGAGGIMRKADKMLYSGESVLIPRKGSLNNILYVSGDFWTIDTMFYTTPKKNNIVKYAYCFLRLLDMFSFDVGAAVPSMTVKILSSIKLLVPTDTVLHSFERIMQPMFQQMDTLAEQNKNLIKQRDLLLPRLMSGKLAV